VKQSDLGEYEANARERKICNIQDKASTPPETKAKQKLPLKPTHVDENTKFQTQEGSKKAQGFSMQKIILPLNSRQIKPSVKFNQRRQLPVMW
jgi:hypothetical protein